MCLALRSNCKQMKIQTFPETILWDFLTLRVDVPHALPVPFVLVCALGKTLLRCAVLAILQLHPGSVVLLAPVCSSFSFMCSSQSQRFWWAPLGDETRTGVKLGNLMANRVTLLCWLCQALGHVFLVEQPGSPKFGDMPRWVHFCTEICYADWLEIDIWNSVGL